MKGASFLEPNFRLTWDNKTLDILIIGNRGYSNFQGK